MINGQNHVRKAGKVFSKVGRRLKAVVSGVRGLFMLIFAGGWIAVLAVVICCLFGAALYFFGDSSSNNYIPVSAEVESYTPVIEKYAKEYRIPEYVELIKAVMMQESGGRGTDFMQASECSLKTQYPQKLGGITE